MEKDPSGQFNQAKGRPISKVYKFDDDSPNSTKVVMTHYDIPEKPGKVRVFWQGVEDTGYGTQPKPLSEVEDKTDLPIGALVGEPDIDRKVLEDNTSIDVGRKTLLRLKGITHAWACENHFEDLKAKKVALLKESMGMNVTELNVSAETQEHE